MTTSLALFVYLIFMLAIFVVAAHFTKGKLHASEGSDEEEVPETPFVESTETVEFSECTETEENEVRILFPNGREHKLASCYRGDTAEMDVEVYVAEGMTLIVKTRKLVNY